MAAALPPSPLALERLFRDDLQDGSPEQLYAAACAAAGGGAGEGAGALGGDRLAADDALPLVQALLLGMDVYG